MEARHTPISSSDKTHDGGTVIVRMSEDEARALMRTVIITLYEQTAYDSTLNELGRTLNALINNTNDFGTRMRMQPNPDTADVGDVHSTEHTHRSSCDYDLEDIRKCIPVEVEDDQTRLRREHNEGQHTISKRNCTYCSGSSDVGNTWGADD